MRQRVRVGARTDLDLEQRFPQELLLVGQRQHEHPARPRQSRCIAPQTVHDGCQTGLQSKIVRVLKLGDTKLRAQSFGGFCPENLVHYVSLLRLKWCKRTALEQTLIAFRQVGKRQSSKH